MKHVLVACCQFPCHSAGLSEVKLFKKAFLKIARQPSTGFVIVFVFVILRVVAFVLVFVFVFGWSGTVAHLEAKLPRKHFSKLFAGQTSAPELPQ